MNNLKLIYLVSFLEGAALMAAELLSAKIMAPYFGTSLTVWTSVLVCTLTALATGYYVGGKISQKKNYKNTLLYILICATILFFLMHPLANLVMSKTINLSILLGSVISAVVFLFPLIFCFALVSPLIIQIISKELNSIGEKASLIYTISTVGGIISTLIFGLNFIPTLGLKVSIIIASSLMLIATFLYYMTKPSN